jgi:hypothetical protein
VSEGDVLELPVVSSSAGGVDETPGDTRDEELVGDGEFYDRVERLFPQREHRVEFLRLRYRARETVENKAIYSASRKKKKTGGEGGQRDW